MYTSCLNYGKPEKGHRANGFTTDGGFTEYAVNHINTLARVPDSMGDAEATLVVTAGTSMYGLTELGGLVAGESVVVIGPGPIGLLAVAVAKALGASPVILTGTRNRRLAIGQDLGADRIININDEDAVEVVKGLTGGIGAGYVVECAGPRRRSTRRRPSAASELRLTPLHAHDIAASDSSQGGQDNLRCQRNLRDNSAKRAERIVDGIGHGRGCTCRTSLAGALCTQFGFQRRRNHVPDSDIRHLA
jgi:threonine dehydrogenase-like Zn-dependent dehydrogenase